jgi:hypothetical protein
MENALIALDRERAHNFALRRTVAAYADALKVSEVQYSGRTGHVSQRVGRGPLIGESA